MPTLIKRSAAVIAAAVLGVTFGAAPSALASPSGSDLPPVADFIGTESFVELGTIDVDAVEGLLEGVEVSEPHAEEDYDRSAFGPAWPDEDGNGCGTRDDILARDLIRVAVDENCVVQSGVLNDIFTGTTIDFTRGVGTSSAVQIDHMIPLGNAWHHGASEWTDQQRRAFANDPTNLTAVDGPTNGSKSDRGPGEWMPPNTDYHCTYAARYAYVAADWELSITQDDMDAILAALDACENALPETPEPTDAPTPTQTADPTAEPTENPTTQPPAPPTAEPTEAPESPTTAPAPPTSQPEESPTVEPTADETADPTLTISPKTIDSVAFGQGPPGGVTIRVDGLEAGQEVSLLVKSPTELVGPLSTDLVADGRGTATFVVRAYVKSYPGVYGVTITGDGVDLTDTFTVTGDIADAEPAPGSESEDRDGDDWEAGGPDSDSRSPLPRTGPASVAASLILAASLIAAGVTVLAGVRRTRT